MGRLKEAKGGSNTSSPLWTQSYAYDRYGNRTSVAKSGVSAGGGAIEADGLASLSFNAASNRITTSGFAYDKAGNQTQSNENSVTKYYVYDAAGRLAQVKDASSNVIATYSYGASNQRLRLQEGGADTYYCWDGGQVTMEYTGNGASGWTWSKSYVYLGGRLLATETASGTQYHHPDRLGTRLVTNSSGGIVSENIGLPYGATISGESYNLAGSASKKRFTSYDRSDATGLDYAVNRHYSAAQGRFTQVDPIEHDASDFDDPQSLNLYAYCGNDPINHIDPDGLFFKKLFGAIKKFFSNIWVRIAILVVLTVIAWGVAVHGWKLAKITVWSPGIKVYEGLTALGWATVYLSSLAGVSAPFWGGRFSTPPTFPGAVENHINKPTGGRGSRGRGGSGSGGRGGSGGPYNWNGPPRSRLEAWARIWRDIMSGRRFAPLRNMFPGNSPKNVLPSNYRLHHIFPQRADLQREFTSRGVTVHEATIAIPEHLHQHLHGGGARGGRWNKMWEDFFKNNPNATREDIFRHTNQELIYQRMIHYPIVNYKK